MPDREKRDSMMSPLRKKIAKWTGVVTSISGCLAGLVLLSVQTCNEIDSVRDRAQDSQRAAEVGYSTLQPAVTELQDIALEASEWGEEVDEEIEILVTRVRELEMQLAKHEAYFDMLKRDNRSLRRAPVAEYREAAEEPPLRHEKKAKAIKPKMDAPPTDLGDAVMQRQQQVQVPFPRIGG